MLCLFREVELYLSLLNRPKLWHQIIYPLLRNNQSFLSDFCLLGYSKWVSKGCNSVWAIVECLCLNTKLLRDVYSKILLIPLWTLLLKMYEKVASWEEKPSSQNYYFPVSIFSGEIQWLTSLSIFLSSKCFLTCLDWHNILTKNETCIINLDLCYIRSMAVEYTSITGN